MVYEDKYLKPVSSLNAFQIPTAESRYTKSLKHNKANSYTNVEIDPTRGFLLSFI